MKKLKSITLFLLLSLMSVSLTAQKASTSKIGLQKRRTVAAKLLVELDKTPQTNSNNNGRSNRDRCCNDGITAPVEYQVLAFGLNSNWFLWEEGVGDIGIPNPIPYFSSIGYNWDVSLYTGDAEYLESKSAYIQDNELLISIDDLTKGKYFIEVENDGNFYATGFSIGSQLPPTSTTIHRKN